MSDTTPRDQLAQIIYDTLNRKYGDFTMPDDAADAIIRAGWRPPARTVTTVEQLDALPVGSIVVRSASGTIACRYDKWNAVALGVGAPFDWTVLALPLTVIYEPEEGE